MTKNVLAIHDISCIGRCSTTVALPILSHFGLECRLLPTALLSTHTAFENYSFLDLTAEMQKILTAWQPLNLQFDGIYSGYLASAEQVDIIKGLTKNSSALKIIDPVMGDNGQLYAGFEASFVEKMRELLELADVLTPNLTEACLLADLPYTEKQDYETLLGLSEKLHKIGAKKLVITGIHWSHGDIATLISVQSGGFELLKSEEIAGDYYGTGDIFASVLTAQLMNGKNLIQAASQAIDFVSKSIKATPSSIDLRYGVNFEEVLKNEK